MELFNSFALFNYLNSRLPLTNWHVFARWWKTRRNKRWKVKLKNTLGKIQRDIIKQFGFFTFTFCTCIFLRCTEDIPKYFLTENLSLKTLSFEENFRMLEFSALMEICAEMNSRIISSTSSNNERKMEEKWNKKWKLVKNMIVMTMEQIRHRF